MASIIVAFSTKACAKSFVCYVIADIADAVVIKVRTCSSRDRVNLLAPPCKNDCFLWLCICWTSLKSIEFPLWANWGWAFAGLCWPLSRIVWVVLAVCTVHLRKTADYCLLRILIIRVSRDASERQVHTTVDSKSNTKVALERPISNVLDEWSQNVTHFWNTGNVTSTND